MRFMHIIVFNAMKALGMVQMHWIMQKEAIWRYNKRFPAFKRVFEQKRR